MAKNYCGASVTRSGGYWTGICRRPIGHTGAHRQRPTRLDNVIFLLQAGWTVWAPHGARIAHACENQPYGGTRQVRLADLRQLVQLGLLMEEAHPTGVGTAPDTEWKLATKTDGDVR